MADKVLQASNHTMQENRTHDSLSSDECATQGAPIVPTASSSKSNGHLNSLGLFWYDIMPWFLNSKVLILKAGQGTNCHGWCIENEMPFSSVSSASFPFVAHPPACMSLGSGPQALFGIHHPFQPGLCWAGKPSHSLAGKPEKQRSIGSHCIQLGSLEFVLHIQLKAKPANHSIVEHQASLSQAFDPWKKGINPPLDRSLDSISFGNGQLLNGN